MIALSTITIVDPAAELDHVSEALAPRLQTLTGKRIALIDNTKQRSQRNPVAKRSPHMDRDNSRGLIGNDSLNGGRLRTDNG
jgi:hypothetical protein